MLMTYLAITKVVVRRLIGYLPLLLQPSKSVITLSVCFNRMFCCIVAPRKVHQQRGSARVVILLKVKLRYVKIVLEVIGSNSFSPPDGGQSFDTGGHFRDLRISPESVALVCLSILKN